MQFRVLVLGGAAAGAVAALIGWTWSTESDSERAARVGDALPAAILSLSADAQFARVESPGRFTFPADHGGHPAYRTEWWHLMGTLDTDAGPPLGVQWLLLRIAISPEPPDHASRWATSNVYMSLLSVSDRGGRRLATDERVARAALGLAGAGGEPLRLWIEDWRLEQTGFDGEALEFSWRAATADLELELTLTNARPLVDGRRLAGPEAPFRFYVQPQLTASGTLRAPQLETAVTGTFSLEHAWGELPLPGGPVARDRFTLYLDDGSVLFAVRTHRSDRSGTPEASGLLLGRRGDAELLANDDIEFDPAGYWTSPRTGAQYPTRWLLRMPGQGMELALSPYRQNQEGSGWLPFWAGPVQVEGAGSAGTSGHGMVLLSGYQER